MMFDLHLADELAIVLDQTLDVSELSEKIERHVREYMSSGSEVSKETYGYYDTLTEVVVLERHKNVTIDTYVELSKRRPRKPISLLGLMGVRGCYIVYDGKEDYYILDTRNADFVFNPPSLYTDETTVKDLLDEMKKK